MHLLIMQSRFVLYCVSSILALATVLWLYREPLSALQQERKGVERLEAELQDPPLRKHLVVASIKKENTSWIQEQLPDWNASIYVADDPQASLTVPQNKGREGMAFLTYRSPYWSGFAKCLGTLLTTTTIYPTSYFSSMPDATSGTTTTRRRTTPL